MSPHQREGDKIVFGANPVSIGVTVSCLHNIMNLLADLNQICMDITLGHEELIRFW